jgi:hypothetical protein
MANLLDELFTWAAKQPPGNSVSVKIAMTSSTLGVSTPPSTGDPQVTVSEGLLQYHPQVESFHPVTFASPAAGTTQLFSKNGFSSAPNDTDQLMITISALSPYPAYTVSIRALKAGWSFISTPIVDPTTSIVFVPVPMELLPPSLLMPAPTFFTIALGDRLSK